MKYPLLLLTLITTLQAVPISILDHGAKSGELSTSAIQASIDACHEAGGGTVVVPKGVFLSGSLFLKQGVDLHLEKDAVLKGSQNLEDYPKRPTRIEGHTEPWRMALLNAANLTHLNIDGEGTIDGDGEVFWKAFWQRRKENPKCTNLEVERPRLIFIDTCQEVRMEGVTLKNSGFWNLHLYRCEDVSIQGVNFFAPGEDAPVRAPSSDGIDIDSCQRVTVRHCRFAVDDDCIAIKGSKGPLADQDRDSPPVENILVEHCEFVRGHGVVTLGSEATHVRNVLVRHCQVAAGNQLVRLKLRPDTPQLYENLIFEDIELSGDHGAVFAVKPWTQFFDLQGHEPPPSVVSNLILRRLRGHYGSFGDLAGNPGDVIRNLVLEDIQLTLQEPKLQLGSIAQTHSQNVEINGEEWNFPSTARRPRIVVPAR